MIVHHGDDHRGAERYDVVIVGARCAGAATAMLLAREGFRTLVLERAGEGTDTLSTHALMRGGVLQLDRWGLLDRVVATGTPPIRRTVFDYGNETTTVTLKPLRGLDALYAPRRTVLDPILVDAARDAGATIRFGCTVTELVTEQDARVAGVVGHDSEGRRFTVRAARTIGADGIRSRIAALARAPVECQGRFASAVLYGHVRGLTSDAYEWFYSPDVSAGVIPTNDGASCVFVAARPERMRDALAAGRAQTYASLLAAASRELAARVADAGGADRFRSFAGVPGYIKRPWGPGWALVGDAGYYKDPISAHGITDALRDAELVARAVSASLGGARSEAAAMADYAATRDRVSANLFTTTDAIASYRWDIASVERLLRTLSAAATDELALIDSFDSDFDNDLARHERTA